MSSRLNPIRISLIYLAFGTAWILLSDYLAAANWLPVGVETAQTIKGLFYIAVTGALVYGLTSRMASSLRRAESHFRALFDNAPDALFVLDDKQDIISANGVAISRYGHTREKLLTMNAIDLLDPMQTSDTPRQRQVVLEEGTWVEARHIRADGQVFPVEIRSRALRLDGETRVFSSVRDITGRKKAEAELRDSEQRYRTYVDASPMGIFINDADWNIIDVNRAACQILGYERSELVGLHASGLVPDELRDGLMELLRSYSWTGVLRNEMQLRRKVGDLIDVSVEAVSIDKNRYMVFASDITERLVLENQLRQAQKMEAVGQMAGGIAHDFNNLLQAIMGYTDLLLADSKEGTEQQEMLSEVANSGHRAARLVGQLLAFSRRQVMSPEPLELNDTIGKLLKMLGRVIPENIKIDFMPGHTLGLVFADRGMVEQLLMNLCVNARDAMPGGGTLTIETENVLIDEDYSRDHPWAKLGRYVLLSVTDTGQGMDRETLDHIFEPFFTTKAVGAGTGLGLATVYGIVKQHDGLITVYSEPGKGTTFKVYLAVTERRAGDVGTKVEGPTIGGNELVLLAEDDGAVRELARKILERAGYTVLLASDGNEAMAVFEQNADRVQLVLLDVVMPGASGRAVLERIRQLRPGMPVLFASGYSENAIHTNFVLDAGIRLIQKPFARDMLLRAVRQTIDERTTG